MTTAIRINKLITMTITLLIVSFMAMNTLAVPPHPDLLEKKAQKTSLPFYASHIEDMHAKGICTPQKYPDGYAPKSQSGNHAAATGSFKILALLVQFSDNAGSVPAVFFDSLLYDTLGQTIRDYYDEISYGKLDIVTVNMPSSIGWSTAPQTYAYYVNGQNGTGSYPKNSQRLVMDLVNLVDPVVDFSQYDNDGDNFVDVVLVIHAGSGAEFSGSNDDIWSHKWATPSPVVKDGVYIFNYTIQPEYWVSPGDMTIGVYAHELGHAFGLPDLYDTEYDSEGIGKWGLMAYGSWSGPGGDGSSPTHPCAWSKIQMGFTTPINVTSNSSSMTILNSEQQQAIYRLWNSGSASTEYFLIENRQKIDYDSYLPGAGLLIWHIDESKSSNDQQWYPGLDSTAHYLVALEQADGLFELEQSNDYGDAADPFPGVGNNTVFNSSSSPNSNTYTNGGTFVAVMNIQSLGFSIVADLFVGIAAGINDDVDVNLPSDFTLEQNFPNPFNPSTEIRFSLTGNAHTSLEVYNILGEKVNTLLDETMPAGEYSVAWDGEDTEGNQVSSGIYLYRLKVDDQTESKKMVLLK